MPIITVDGPKIDDLEVKRKLVKEFTGTAAEAFNLPKATILVVLHEVGPDCVSTGGDLVCDQQIGNKNAST